MRFRASPSRRVHGLSAIELVVALGVTAVLGSLAAWTLSRVGDAWESSVGALALEAQANRILDVVAADLEAAVLRAGDEVGFAATVQRSPQPERGDAEMVDARWSGRVKPGSGASGSPGASLELAPASGRVEDLRFGQAGLWLRFFTTVPDSNDGLANTSAPRAVAYQIVRRRITASSATAPSAATPARYALYRSTARPMSGGWPDVDSTFAVGYDLFATGTGPGYNRADSSRIDQAGNLRAPRRYEQLLGLGVIDFGVRCWVRRADGVLDLAFPAGPLKTGFASTLADGVPGSAPPVAAPGPGAPAADELVHGFPTQVQVVLRLLTDEGQRLLAAWEAGAVARPSGVSSDDAQWWTLALAHSRIFTRHVHLRADPD
jgi:hypothetical protein